MDFFVGRPGILTEIIFPAGEAWTMRGCSADLALLKVVLPGGPD